MSRQPSPERPGFQYPVVRKDEASLDAAFKNYGDNIQWLYGSADSMQAALAALQKRVDELKPPPGGTVALPSEGTYTPVAIAGVNVDEAVASEAQWIRVGNKVIVSGVLVVNPTAAGACSADIPLPFPSTITDLAQLAGTANQENGVDTGSVLGSVLTGNASMEWTATSTGAYNMAYIYLYQIIGQG